MNHVVLADGKLNSCQSKLDIDGVSRVTCRHPWSQGLVRGASAHLTIRMVLHLITLQKELMILMMSPDKSVSAFPEGENLFKWIGTITGPEGTVYDGLTYKLALEFPHSYPYSAPIVRFLTPCFHPNVDLAGNICLDILKDKWSALYDVRTILLSIQSLLGGAFIAYNGSSVWEKNSARRYIQNIYLIALFPYELLPFDPGVGYMEEGARERVFPYPSSSYLHQQTVFAANYTFLAELFRKKIFNQSVKLVRTFQVDVMFSRLEPF
uniref:UBC core domain-containing protein n=1 Tax=Timema shepardi TaxID=629360 RepID=A0A7R9G537_TIMSH|nr:unnamed protein product [Timema shepardi]